MLLVAMVAVAAVLLVVGTVGETVRENQRET
jgi:hypothetical protein